MTDQASTPSGTTLADTYKELIFGSKARINSPQTGGIIGWIQRFFQYHRGYKELASWWLALVVTCLTAIILVIVFAFNPAPVDPESASYSYRDEVPIVAVISLKVLLVIPLLILLTFGIRSYRINKHLEILYTHRWALQRSVAEHLNYADNDTPTRQKQLLQITPFFFKDIETGYITKKDGLGKDMNPMAIAAQMRKR